MIAAILAIVGGAGAASAAPGVHANPVFGTWANPKRTIAVRTAPCPGGVCGAIVWASPRTAAEAQNAGVVALIGTRLLQDYRPMAPGIWAGRVYVPDMGRSFSSRIRQTSPRTLIISGCVIGGFLCKSQVWHRIA
jgi:uncharacterized protein (DUF2147 family)